MAEQRSIVVVVEIEAAARPTETNGEELHVAAELAEAGGLGERLRRDGILDPEVLRLRVPGRELAVLNGAGDSLLRFRRIEIESCSPERAEELARWLAGHGFSYLHVPAGAPVPAGAAFVRRDRWPPPDGLVALDLADAGRLWLPAADLVGRLLEEGSYEPYERAFCQLYLRPGDTVVDCGAHVGLYSAIAARLVGDEGRVVAVEPNPATAALLRRNLAGARSARVVEAALGAGERHATLHLGKTGNSAFDSVTDSASEFRGDEVVEVAAMSLDELLASVGSPKVELLKLDVEGHELRILEGAMASIRAGRLPLMIVEFTEANARAAGGTRALAAALRELGYRLHRLDPVALRLVSEPERETYGYDNLFAAADVAAVNARLAAADPERTALARALVRRADAFESGVAAFRLGLAAAIRKAEEIRRWAERSEQELTETRQRAEGNQDWAQRTEAALVQAREVARQNEDWAKRTEDALARARKRIVQLEGSPLRQVRQLVGAALQRLVHRPPPSRAAAPVPAARAPDLPWDVESYVADPGGMAAVEGWLLPPAARLIAWFSRFQTAHGVRGSLCEVGAHHGRTAVLLGLLRADGETLRVCDPFAQAGAYEALQANVRRFLGGTAGVEVLRKRSVELQDAELAGVRLLHVDGDKSAKAVRGDLAAATRTLHERGVVIVDDVYNVVFPGVTEAILTFLAGSGSLVPLVCGFNKMVLCRREQKDFFLPLLQGRALEEFAAQNDHVAAGRPLLDTYTVVTMLPRPRPARAVASPVQKEFTMAAALDHLRRKGFSPRVVWDVGAAQGYWSLDAVKRFPEAVFYMVEPLAENEPHLRRLAAGDPRLRYTMCAAGSKTGEAQIHVASNLDASSLLSFGPTAGPNDRVVRVRALDELLAEGVLEPPQLVKIDVQGFELEALEGARRVWETAEVFILEVSLFRFMAAQPLAHEVIDYMLQRGFVLFDVAGSLRRPNQDDLGQLDLVFVRERGRLRASNSWD
jgi:FkbM family methyltransferase